MDLIKTSEAVSLALSVPTLLLAVLVVWKWSPRILTRLSGQPMSEAEWIILGVSISFLGSMLDNLYWMVPWTLSYVNSAASDEWFAHGAIGNIFFRQIAGIIAACCHLKSVYAGKRGFRSLSFVIAAAHALGIVYLVALTV